MSSVMYWNLIKIFLPTTVTFFLGLILTPIATHFFYKYKMWKKYSRSTVTTTSDFAKFHNEKEELHTPRVGGVIIWVSVLATVLIFYLTSIFFPSISNSKMNFLSRNQTLIPFFTLLLGALIGLWDDLVQIYGHGKFARDDKSWRMWKAFLVGLMSLAIGFWFFFKLEMTSIHIPFNGQLHLGILIRRRGLRRYFNYSNFCFGRSGNFLWWSDRRYRWAFRRSSSFYFCGLFCDSLCQQSDRPRSFLWSSHWSNTCLSLVQHSTSSFLYGRDGDDGAHHNLGYFGFLDRLDFDFTHCCVASGVDFSFSYFTTNFKKI